MPRADKVGATSDFPTSHDSGLDPNTECLKELVQTLQERENPDLEEKETLKSIGRTEERYDYIAGAYGYYHRPLLPSLFGKDKFKGMRQLQDHSRPTLREHKINVIVNSRLCYGIPAVQIGGKSVKDMPKHCIGAADFQPSSEEALIITPLVSPIKSKTNRPLSRPSSSGTSVPQCSATSSLVFTDKNGMLSGWKPWTGYTSSI